MEEDQICIKEGNAFWFLAFIRCFVQMEMQWRTDAERKFGLFDNGEITKKSYHLALYFLLLYSFVSLNM